MTSSSSVADRQEPPPRSRLAMLGYRVVLVAGRPSRRARLVHHLPPTIAPAAGGHRRAERGGGVGGHCRAPPPGDVGRLPADRRRGQATGRARRQSERSMRSSSRPRGRGGRSSEQGHTVEHARHRPTGGWDLWLQHRRRRHARSVPALSSTRPVAASPSAIGGPGGRRRRRRSTGVGLSNGTCPRSSLRRTDGCGLPPRWRWTAVRLSSCCSLIPVPSSGSPARDRRSRYAEVVRHSLELGAAVEPSSLGSCDATPMWSRQPVGPDLVRVGDAALTLDPLSSDGVRSAAAVCAARCRRAAHHGDPTAGRPPLPHASSRTPPSAPSATTVESPRSTTRREAGRTSTRPGPSRRASRRLMPPRQGRDRPLQPG